MVSVVLGNYLGLEQIQRSGAWAPFWGTRGCRLVSPVFWSQGSVQFVFGGRAVWALASVWVLASLCSKERVAAEPGCVVTHQ